MGPLYSRLCQRLCDSVTQNSCLVPFTPARGFGSPVLSLCLQFCLFDSFRQSCQLLTFRMLSLPLVQPNSSHYVSRGECILILFTSAWLLGGFVCLSPVMDNLHCQLEVTMETPGPSERFNSMGKTRSECGWYDPTGCHSELNKKRRM